MMANNRLYIYCPRCNEYLFLGKHFGSPYNLQRGYIEDLQDFIDDHFYCRGENDPGVCLLEEAGNFESMTGRELPEGAINWKEKHK